MCIISHGIAEKRIAEFQDISCVDPSIDTGNRVEELEKAECFACWKPLLDSVYLSPNCGFYLHEKCVDLPPEINHPFHQQHPLLLQFNSQSLSCKICHKTQRPGFVYCCSSCEFVLDIQCATIPTEINKPYHRKYPLFLQSVNEYLPCQLCQETTRLNDAVYFCSICKFVLHIRCVSSPPIIEDKRHHEHPFTLVERPTSFCDACGTVGDYVPYFCFTCNLLVHKKCISLPRIIKFYRHQHSLPLTYFLKQREPETWECRVCFKEVNTEHGSYFCSKCNFIVHVKCATKYRIGYYEVFSIEAEEAVDSDERTDLREIMTATWIKHSWHQHNLTWSEDHIWYCKYQTTGFGYTCAECRVCYCLRCSLVPDITRCEGHEHKLRWYEECQSKGWCNACGGSTRSAYKCKSCDFALHDTCIILPVTARHRSDEHPFKLTYHDDDYSESNYCDICEKERNPKHWFYRCSACNSSAHTKCVLGKYSFIKPGTIYTIKGDHHPHPLTIVKKDHHYLECHRCGEPCFDLALECKMAGFSYIAHWDCRR